MININYEDLFAVKWIKGLIPEVTEENKTDPEIISLVQEELDRCLGGVYIDGIFFSGWLYWHLNHWWIRDDIEDEFGNILRRQLRPSLRDNEWIVGQYLEQCRVEKKGYLHIGVRQFGKSEIMASYLAYHATLFEHTQNVIVGGNEDDLNLLKDKIDFGIKSLWGGIKIPKLDKDTKKNMIRLGVKTKSNEDEIWSYLIVRNVSEGKRTEGPAGVTAKAFAMDEIGKFPFGQAFKAAKPAFVSKFGWRCVPILFGTGGSFDKGEDAERYFYHPEANNFLAVVDPITAEKTGIFMSGLYRIDCKYQTNLADYLIKEEMISPDADYLQLKQIIIQVSDKERAEDLIHEERKQAANDPDQTEYLKLVMYYPLTPKECFLSSAENFYNGNIARKKREKLETEGYIPMFVELVEEGDKITHIPTTKLPISSFPTKATENLDACICILEHPIPNAPWGLYIAGVDPYRFDKSKNTDSLGAVYIFKRAYDVQSDSFQDMFVAWYVARPGDKSEWNNNARLLIKYYNANALCENDEMSFIDYMIAKGDGHMLADTPDWLKEFNGTSSTMLRNKGISSSPPRHKQLLRSTFKQYMEEPFISVPIPGTTETRRLLGVEKINDRVGLMEVENWNEDGNFDREIAMSIAITHARKLDRDRFIPQIVNEDPRFKMTHTPKRNSLFSGSRGLSINNKRNPIKRLFK